MSAPLAETSAPVAEGDVLAGKFLVERVLGQGAMGIVVAAKHIQLQQRVAIKFLTGRATPEVRARFRREAQSASRLRNEHVAKVTDVGELEDRSPYMVMEYLSGNDLQQVLRAEGPMPVSEAVGFILQVCEAMAEAHSLGIIHRDLKPANLFLTTSSDGSKMVKVLDFGISKGANEGEEAEGMALTRTEAVLGSPLYMSMEQMRSSRDVDARADIYALGAILYQLLTGRVPFEAQTFPELILKVASEEPPPPSTFRPDLPPPLEQAILRCLQKNRDHRFTNVGELAAAIAPFATDEGIGSAERVLRTIDKSTGATGANTLSSANLRATRNSMTGGGTRTGSTWSTSSAAGQGGVRAKTIGLALVALVLGAATVLAVVTLLSRPSATAAVPASSATAAAPTSTETAAATTSAPSAPQATLTPVVVPAPYNDPTPARPAVKPSASASSGPTAPPAPGPAQTQPPAQTAAPPATTQAPAPQPTPAPTPAPTPTATQKKNPLDIDIK